MVPAAVGVTFTEQLAEDPDGFPSVQVPPGVKVTVPVGAVAPDVRVSLIVAVHEVAWLMSTFEGVQVTLVDVE